MSFRFLSPINLHGNEIRNARFQNLATAPSSPAEGQHYWDTTLGQLRIWNGSSWVGLGTGTGTVTSVALSMPSMFTVSGSPITTNGTFTVNLANQSANTFFAGPTSGSGAPTFRAIAQSDLPNTVPLSFWAVPTAAVSFNNQRLTSLGTPTAAQDAVTKEYVDNLVAGLDVKPSVRLATTGNITLSGTQTIDGVALAAGDRVLVKNQTTQSQNGIYTVSTGSWTRVTDMDSWDEVPGAFVFVEAGTTNADTGWVCTSNAGGTLGTTAITFEQFTGLGQVVAGNGLTKTGNVLDVGASNSSITVVADGIAVNLNGTASGLEISSGLRIRTDTTSANTIGVTITSNGAGIKFNSTSFEDSGSETLALASSVAGDGLVLTTGALHVNVDGTTLEIASDAIRVKDAGVTFGKIAGGVWGSTLDTTGNVVNVKGYTSVTGATVARMVTSAQTLGTGSFSVAVTHNLGSQNVIVQVRDTGSNEMITTNVEYTSANVVTISGVNNTGSSINAQVMVVG